MGFCLWFEFPKKGGLRQVFDCKLFIWEVIQEALVGEVGNETGKGRQPMIGCTNDRLLLTLLGSLEMVEDTPE